MISRVADHCFWLGRYLERVESTARVLAVTRNLALDADVQPSQCWHPVLVVSGEEPRLVARFGAAAPEDSELVQIYLTWDDQNAVSLRSSTRRARENAAAIRDVVGREAWEVLNELYVWMGSEAARADYEHHRHAFFQRTRNLAQLAIALFPQTMLRDSALWFIELGGALERAGQSARLLDVHHHVVSGLTAASETLEEALWLSLLRAYSGFEPFMKTRRGDVSAEAVAEFLIVEPRFPRSIRAALEVARDRLHRLWPDGSAARSEEGSLRRLQALETWLLALREPWDEKTVHAILTRVVDETAAVCDAVGRELQGTRGPAAPSALSRTPPQ